MELKPQYDQSIAFLRRFHPNRRWCLTSISLDKREIATRTFSAASEAECIRWLEVQGEKKNLYFSVNPPFKDVHKKPQREDVHEINHLHVDIDPRAGEDIHAERERILKLLKDPPGLALPTAIVSSGSGYQAFFALNSPIVTNGSLELAEDAKLYNLQLELLLGADSCHNIDRICRLPGTINLPDATKLKKGRKAALAEVVSWEDKLVYDITSFTKAPQTQIADVGGSLAAPVAAIKISGNIRRFGNVDEIPGDLSNKLKVVLVQGMDPDEPRKFPSRSEWLFYATCSLIRANVTEEDIYSILTDPNYSISASVLDKGSATEKYALRTIARAKEEAESPHLRQLNEKHAVITNMAGKCRIVEEQWDDSLNRFRLTKQTFEDFRNRYMNVQIQVGNNDKGAPVFRPLGDWWLKNEKRRQFDRIVFAPGREVMDAYNLWRGFACEARPGDCSLFLEHLRDNICQGNEEHYRYLLGWFARAVQKPDNPGYAAIVLRGGQGTGKSFVAKTFGSLFGRHYMSVTDPKHLVGSFNAHLRDCVVLFGDEAFYAGDKKHESVLKMLVTEDTLTVEAKGVDAETSNNCIHLLMASNEQWVVPAGMDDRRFFVLEVGDGKKNNAKFFTDMQHQLATGGREALLHYFLNYDIIGFNVRQVPKTSALQKQKLYSMSPSEDWFFNKVMDGKLLSEHPGWLPEVNMYDLHEDFLSFCKQFSMGRRGSAFAIRQMLESFAPGLKKFQTDEPITVTENGTIKTIKRPYYYRFPDLSTMRTHWDSKFGGPHSWNSNTIQQEYPELVTSGHKQDDIPF